MSPGAAPRMIVSRGGTGFGWPAIVAVKFAGAGFCLWLASQPGRLWIGLAGAVLFAAFAAIDAVRWRAADARVELSAAGLLDRRWKVEVPLPWSEIESIGCAGGAGGCGTLFLTLKPGARWRGPASTHLTIDCAPLDRSGPQLVAAMRRFAPDLPIDPRFRAWLA